MYHYLQPSVGCLCPEPLRLHDSSTSLRSMHCNQRVNLSEPQHCSLEG